MALRRTIPTRMAKAADTVRRVRRATLAAQHSGAAMNPFDLFVSSVLPGQRAVPPRRNAQDALEEMEREIDDTLINAAVKIAVHRDPLLRTAGIQVATSRHVVQLSG